MTRKFLQIVILSSPIQISGEAPVIPSAAGKSKYSISISMAAAAFQTLSNSFVFLTNRRILNNYGNVINDVINK
jgi:hypothetical protein